MTNRSPWTAARLSAVFEHTIQGISPAASCAVLNTMPGRGLRAEAVADKMEAIRDEGADLPPELPKHERPTISFWTVPPAPPYAADKPVPRVYLPPARSDAPRERRKIPFEGDGGFSLFGGVR